MAKKVEKEQIQEVTLKTLVKIMKSSKGMTMKEVARNCGRDDSTLSAMLKTGNPTLKNIVKVFNGMGEDLVVTTSNGHKYKVICE